MTQKRGPRTTYDEVKKVIEALTKENDGERPPIRAIAKAIGKNPSTTTITKFQARYYLESAQKKGDDSKPTPTNPLAEQINQIWEEMVGSLQEMEDNLRQDVAEEWDRISRTLVSKEESLSENKAALQQAMEKNDVLIKENGEQSKEIEILKKEIEKLIVDSNKKSATIVQLGQECEITRQEARAERAALHEKESKLQSQFREALSEEKQYQRRMAEQHEMALKTLNETRDTERAIAEGKRAELQERLTGQESEKNAACSRVEQLEQQLQNRVEQVSELKDAVNLVSAENKVLTQDLRDKDAELRREVDAYAKRAEKISERYMQSLNEKHDSLEMYQQENKQLREDNERLERIVNMKEAAGGSS